jgi:hypothetical protein
MEAVLRAALRDAIVSFFFLLDLPSTATNLPRHGRCSLPQLVANDNCVRRLCDAINRGASVLRVAR